MGVGWVRVHRVQALTSLRLRRLKELLEDWESMGDLTGRHAALGDLLPVR